MSAENSSPPSTDEIRLLLIGPPKTGQSSIANILAGVNVFPVGASSSVNSATPTTQSRHYTNKKILVGKHLLIVDAPVCRFFSLIKLQQKTKTKVFLLF
jgi:ribosome biogenesis GTPase A